MRLKEKFADKDKFWILEWAPYYLDNAERFAGDDFIMNLFEFLYESFRPLLSPRKSFTSPPQEDVKWSLQSMDSGAPENRSTKGEWQKRSP